MGLAPDGGGQLEWVWLYDELAAILAEGLPRPRPKGRVWSTIEDQVGM